jgi:hypothetical protein
MCRAAHRQIRNLGLVTESAVEVEELVLNELVVRDYTRLVADSRAEDVAPESSIDRRDDMSLELIVERSTQ